LEIFFFLFFFSFCFFFFHPSSKNPHTTFRGVVPERCISLSRPMTTGPGPGEHSTAVLPAAAASEAVAANVPAPNPNPDPDPGLETAPAPAPAPAPEPEPEPTTPEPEPEPKVQRGGGRQHTDGNDRPAVALPKFAQVPSTAGTAGAKDVDPSALALGLDSILTALLGQSRAALAAADDARASTARNADTLEVIGTRVTSLERDVAARVADRVRAQMAAEITSVAERVAAARIAPLAKKLAASIEMNEELSARLDGLSARLGSSEVSLHRETVHNGKTAEAAQNASTEAVALATAARETAERTAQKVDNDIVRMKRSMIEQASTTATQITAVIKQSFVGTSWCLVRHYSSCAHSQKMLNNSILFLKKKKIHSRRPERLVTQRIDGRTHQLCRSDPGHFPAA
jgi:predicted DNA-binding protein